MHRGDAHICLNVHTLRANYAVSGMTDLTLEGLVHRRRGLVNCQQRRCTSSVASIATSTSSGALPPRLALLPTMTVPFEAMAIEESKHPMLLLDPKRRKVRF